MHKLQLCPKFNSHKADSRKQLQSCIIYSIFIAGIYHRFIPNCGDYIKALRLFQVAPTDNTLWKPINRNESEVEISQSTVRKNYLKAVNC